MLRKPIRHTNERRRIAPIVREIPTLTLFALGHNDELLGSLPDLPNIVPVALHHHVGESCYSEFRFFCKPLRIQSEYVGFISCRWPEKFPGVTPIDQLQFLPLSPTTVYAPAPTEEIDWVSHSQYVHPGLAWLLPPLAKAMGVELRPHAQSFWTSNFICHRDVWEDYQQAFARGVQYAVETWGNDPPFEVGLYHPSRKFGYLLERANMIYFASRTDLTVVKI